jgi:hypothetical protein
MGRLARFLTGVLVMLGLLAPAGCSSPPSEWTPEKRKETAKQAGALAVTAWVAIEKPDKALVAAVKVVTDKVSSTLTAYETGGFKKALPGINAGLAALFPKEEDKAKLMLAMKFAEILVSELDKLFDQHPDWKSLGSEVAGITAAFASGASESLDLYLK